MFQLISMILGGLLGKFVKNQVPRSTPGYAKHILAWVASIMIVWVVALILSGMMPSSFGFGYSMGMYTAILAPAYITYVITFYLSSFYEEKVESDNVEEKEEVVNE